MAGVNIGCREQPHGSSRVIIWKHKAVVAAAARGVAEQHCSILGYLQMSIACAQMHTAQQVRMRVRVRGHTEVAFKEVHYSARAVVGFYCSHRHSDGACCIQPNHLGLANLKYVEERLRDLEFVLNLSSVGGGEGE